MVSVEARCVMEDMFAADECVLLLRGFAFRCLLSGLGDCGETGVEVAAE